MILLISTAIVSMMLGCGLSLVAIGICATGKRADPCDYCNGAGLIQLNEHEQMSCPECHGFCRRRM